jgi:glyoxylase I family protein
MLRNFEHVGIVCSNLDRTVDFYVGQLGLREVLRKPGRSGGTVAFLDAGGGMLEIVQPDGPVKTPARQVGRDEAGMRHISLTVDDLDATYDRLVAAGVTFTEPPRNAYNTEVLKKVAFCLDPDGISVELAER